MSTDLDIPKRNPMHNEQKRRFLPDVWVGPKTIPGQLCIASPRGIRRHSDHGILPKIIGLDEIDDAKEISHHHPICSKYTKLQQTSNQIFTDDVKNDHIIGSNRRRNMFKDMERKHLRFGSLDRECKM